MSTLRPASPDDGQGGFAVEKLLVESACPHPVAHFQLKQTHVSWIVLTGPFAYKIKKPVRYSFIDASTLERRHQLCEEELRLNRRFAPDLYLDVVAITSEDGQLKFGGRGKPLEYAVKMHQFDPSQELATRLAGNDVTVQDIDDLAARIADSHLRAAVAPAESPYGSFEKLRQAMQDNFDLLGTHLNGAAEVKLLEQLARWTDEALARLRPLIIRRRQSGMVRECHGDLHARNIVRWQQQWMPFDCLEFDPELRWIDVISDVAFLYMDLRSRHRDDLAYQFLSRYLEETGDYQGLRLLPLYAAYLALVRAKVDALDADTAREDELRSLEARLAARLATATGFMDTKPLAIIVMNGVSGSGKSWLSERMVPQNLAVRIRSDLERKRLAGVAPLARRVNGIGEGAYTAASIQRTYQWLAECADCAIEGGCNVIVDATFLDRVHRDSFRALAMRRHCRFLVVSCSTDASTLAARIDSRAHGGADPSEATLPVVESQFRSWQPLAADELPDAVQVDTSRLASANAGLAEVRSRLAAFGCLGS
jgi:hypothetical protein